MRYDPQVSPVVTNIQAFQAWYALSYKRTITNIKPFRFDKVNESLKGLIVMTPDEIWR